MFKYTDQNMTFLYHRISVNKNQPSNKNSNSYLQMNIKPTSTKAVKNSRCYKSSDHVFVSSGGASSNSKYLFLKHLISTYITLYNIYDFTVMQLSQIRSIMTSQLLTVTIQTTILHAM